MSTPEPTRLPASRGAKQTCPDEASAAAALGKLLARADGDHFPNREATLGQGLAKYLEVADLEVSTRGSTPGLRPPHHRARARRGEDPQARRGLPRLALYGPGEVLAAMPSAPADRALHGGRARV